MTHRFHHFGIAVSSLKESIRQYEGLGYSKEGEIVEDHVQKVSICFMESAFSPRIELIEPLTEISPVSKILAQSGTSPYHICFEVDSEINEGIEAFKKKGLILVSKANKAPAIGDRRVCFMYSRAAGLIELVERDE